MDDFTAFIGDLNRIGSALLQADQRTGEVLQRFRDELIRMGLANGGGRN